MSNIVVIGSANIDTTHYLNSDFPEELTNESVNLIIKSMKVLGGKGANQSVAAKKQARDIDEVFFIGCVGQDESGIKILENFKEQGINYSGVKVLDGSSTDGRIITVDKNGDNRMIGYGECIKQLTPDILEEEKIKVIIEKADIVMIQMKMPPETVESIVNYCNIMNKRVLIDPTPPEKASLLIEKGLLKQATFLTPNEDEAYALSQYLKGYTFDEIKERTKSTTQEERIKEIIVLVEKFPNIIATLGDKGVLYNKDGKAILKKAYSTQCKDSTGAGDTFNGAFIAAIIRGEDLEQAINYAQMTSSIKVRHEGAQNGIPTYRETNIELNKKNLDQK